MGVQVDAAARLEREGVCEKNELGWGRVLALDTARIPCGAS